MGINAETGEEISGAEYVHQAIRDVLLTRIGTRPLRRDYGSLVPDYIDRPQSPSAIASIANYGSVAINKWVTGYRVKRISPVLRDGELVLHIEPATPEQPTIEVIP